jgi:hypothetical protein
MYITTRIFQHKRRRCASFLKTKKMADLRAFLTLVFSGHARRFDFLMFCCCCFVALYNEKSLFRQAEPHSGSRKADKMTNIHESLENRSWIKANGVDYGKKCVVLYYGTHFNACTLEETTDVDFLDSKGEYHSLTGCKDYWERR